jgi:hypothetical protein
MDLNDIDAVLNVSHILTQHGQSDAAHTPSLIADLIDWADSRVDLGTGEPDEVIATVVDKPKAKRGKATEPDDSVPGDGFTATPDPSEPDF